VSGRLVCRLRAGLTLSFNLGEAEAVLGRDPELAVPLPAEGVSRRHARVSWDGKSHWVEDLRSTNGTFVNGHPVSREKLRHLDVLTVGKGVELVFLTSEAQAPAAPRLAIVRALLIELGADGTVHEIAVGEATLGRSPSCNVISDAGDVSKVHARVERTRDQLLLEDLGSANGTYVNDARVQSAFLKAGDVVRLGGTEKFRVDLETGTISGGSGRHSEAIAREARAEQQRFSADWKTRFLLTGEEREHVMALRQRLRERDAGQTASPFEKTKRSPAAPAPAKAAPSAAAQPAQPTPVKPTAATPTATPASKAPAPGIESMPTPSRPMPAQPLPQPKPPSPPAGAKPRSTPAAPKAPAAAAPPANKKAVAPPGIESMPTPARPLPAQPKPPPTPVLPIREIRFSSDTLSLVVSTPGEHVLGRSPDAAVRIDHPTVSRRHATVVVSDDRTVAYLRHEGGINGTRLNTRLVDKLTPLADGDVLSMGDVELRVAVVRGQSPK
jgi:pSer/pThr/pTyr-binding forkhead associated (FHA) protein